MSFALSLFSRGKNISERTKDAAHAIASGLGIKHFSGPAAVEANLLKGLRELRVVYNLNPRRELYASALVLRKTSSVSWLLRKGVAPERIIVGPNITPKEALHLLSFCPSLRSILVPSQVVKQAFCILGVPEKKISIWPVGIDVADFPNCTGLPKAIDALIYFKRRNETELAKVKTLLKNFRQRLHVLRYGQYTQAEFKVLLSASRYVVVLDHTETQGIALQEIMASNLPLFVFDQIYQGDAASALVRTLVRASSVPYWDDRCGFRVPTDMYHASLHPYVDIQDTAALFKDFLDRLQTFSPRSFVAEHFTLAGQAQALVDLFTV